MGHAAGFVIAADQGDAAGITKLEADKEGDGFDTEEAAVDVVT